MNPPVTTATGILQKRSLKAMPLARSFVTVAISILALIVACLVFAPSSLSWGALSGSLPFAAIIAIVGLGQLLVVQQGGFDLSLPGAVSLAVVVSTHYPQQDDALLPTAMLIVLAFALGAGLINGILVSVFRLNAIIATIGVNARSMARCSPYRAAYPPSQHPCWPKSPVARPSAFRTRCTSRWRPWLSCRSS
jgi:ribose transport system permease protein